MERNEIQFTDGALPYLRPLSALIILLAELTIHAARRAWKDAIDWFGVEKDAGIP